MWIEKMRNGVLAVQVGEDTLHYLRPSLGDRIKLLWMFRNFRLLPQQVLRPRELTLVAGLLETGNFQQNGDCRIGTVEWLASDPALIQRGSLNIDQPALPDIPHASECSPATTSIPNRRGKRRRRKMRAG
jgi:hypothetical protein